MAREPKAHKNRDNQYYSELQEFIEEFKNESDRAAVILGAAKLDNFLYQILSTALLASSSSRDELLDGDSPLGTFSSRIMMTFRLGLITADFAKTLNLIRKIRNSFAHEISGATINSGGHSDRIRELALPFKNLRDYEKFRSEFFDGKNDIASDFRCVLTIALLRLHFLSLSVENMFKICKDPMGIIPEKWSLTEEKIVAQKARRKEKTRSVAAKGSIKKATSSLG